MLRRHPVASYFVLAYNGTGGSVLLVTLWHGTYNLAGGTAAAKGAIAAMVSAVVITWAILLTRAARRPQRAVEATPTRGTAWRPAA